MVEDEGDARGVGAPAGASRRLEACQSPVWDTALAMIALADAGLPGDAPRDDARRRMAARRGGHRDAATGRWPTAGLAPGGWAFEFANVNYPDVDDTAEVVLALRRVAGALNAAANGGSARAARRSRIDAAIGRALRWVQGMQSSDGGWGAFDADNTRALVRELPFLDFGEVIDEPSADVTAHAVEMLAALGLADTPAARRGVRWLIESQEPDGSWFGRWGVNHVYGTGAAVPGADRRRGRAAGAVHSPRGGLAARTTRTRTAAGARTRAPTTIPPGSAAARAPPRRPPGRCSRCTPPGAATARALAALGAAWTGWSRPSAPTGPGTSRSTPAPAFRPTTTSTITSTGSPSRSWRSAAACARAPRGGEERTIAASPSPGAPAGGDARDAQAPMRMPARRGRDGARRGENFPVASRLLARGACARHLLAIYGFARLVDELGDSCRRRSPGRAGLAGTGAGSGLSRCPPSIRCCVRLQPTLRECALPREPFVRLIEANRLDQRVSRYETWEQLRALLRAVGRPRRRARARRARPGHARADRAVESNLHRAAAHRALPGRCRGSGPRARLPAGRGPRPLRLHDRRSCGRPCRRRVARRCSPSRSLAHVSCLPRGVPGR